MDQASVDDSGIDNFGGLSLFEDRDENLPASAEVPGPITKTATSGTSELPREAPTAEAQESESLSESYFSKELLTPDWTERDAYYRSLEEKAFKKYSAVEPEEDSQDGRKSFCYLLLDPRVTRDLPRRGADLSPTERWRIFLEAVFYVGKGKRKGQSKEAPENPRRSRISASEDERKTRRICNIGKEGQGVVCLQVFSYAANEETSTRQACMIEAFNVSNQSHLTNTQKGSYYGDAKAMSLDDKSSLGKYLLYKSMEIFMHSGEVQHEPGISPEDHIKQN